MSDSPPLPSETALELRRAFDQVFAEAPVAVRAKDEHLLALGLAGEAYALRLSEIAGLFKDRKVTVLPSALPEFLGVAGLQGRVVPVYDLQAFLGHAPAVSSRWLALVLAPEPLGLAFDAFEGQFRAPRELIAPAPSGGRRHVSQAVRTGDLLRQVVDVASVVEAIRSRARPDRPAKER